MARRFILTGLVAALVVSAAVVSVAIAQERGQRGVMDPAEMRQRNLERVREALTVTDAEWAAMQSSVERVLALSTEQGMAGAARAMGRRPGGQDEQAQSPLAQATGALQAGLQRGADIEEIAALLAAYREARESARRELAAAREALKAMVNTVQEAQLVLAGVLE